MSYYNCAHSDSRQLSLWIVLLSVAQCLASNHSLNVSVYYVKSSDWLYYMLALHTVNSRIDLTA